MREPSEADVAVKEARRGLAALRLEVAPEIADDVTRRVEAAFTALRGAAPAAGPQPSEHRELLLDAAPRGQPSVTCECERGPREIIEDEDAGVKSWRLASHCTQCLAGAAPEGE